MESYWEDCLTGRAVVCYSDMIRSWAAAAQEEYAREGIDWSYVEFVDNQDCLDVLEGSPAAPSLAVFPQIDEACRLPRATYQARSKKEKTDHSTICAAGVDGVCCWVPGADAGRAACQRCITDWHVSCTGSSSCCFVLLEHIDLPLCKCEFLRRDRNLLCGRRRTWRTRCARGWRSSRASRRPSARSTASRWSTMRARSPTPPSCCWRRIRRAEAWAWPHQAANGPVAVTGTGPATALATMNPLLPPAGK